MATDTTKISKGPCSGRATRRHPDCEAHYQAVAEYEAHHGPEARREKAKYRQEERDKLSPREQLKELDKRLGKGVGAQKERARLQTLIEAELEEKGRARPSKKEAA